MLKRLADFLKKHHDLVIYLILGAATTAVNFIVYYPLFNLCHFSATLSNIIAWIIAVLFAFVTNKPFAFKSTDWSAAVTVPEFIKFLGCRVGSGVLETAFLALTVDVLLWNGNIMKLVISIAVVILNYIGSKYIVFRR